MKKTLSGSFKKKKTKKNRMYMYHEKLKRFDAVSKATALR